MCLIRGSDSGGPTDAKLARTDSMYHLTRSRSCSADGSGPDGEKSMAKPKLMHMKLFGRASWDSIWSTASLPYASAQWSPAVDRIAWHSMQYRCTDFPLALWQSPRFELRMIHSADTAAFSDSATLRPHGLISVPDAGTNQRRSAQSVPCWSGKKWPANIRARSPCVCVSRVYCSIQISIVFTSVLYR